MSISDNILKLINTIEINDMIVRDSTIMDNNLKDAIFKMSKSTREILNQYPKMTSYGLLSLKSQILVYWNESINPDTEKFWASLENNGIDYKRKEPLRFALNKNYFRRVEQGIDAKKHWVSIKNLKTVSDRFSATEIQKISEITEQDESKRLEILKKCLRKNSIPKTQYLKFGECMAYFGQCDLFDNYFGKNEIGRLNTIWKNFKSE